MSEQDNRNIVWIHKKKIGMYDHEEVQISLTSKDDTIDQLIQKAKEALK